MIGLESTKLVKNLEIISRGFGSIPTARTLAGKMVSALRVSTPGKRVSATAVSLVLVVAELNGKREKGPLSCDAVCPLLG
jgi:hypothetical protein